MLQLVQWHTVDTQPCSQARHDIVFLRSLMWALVLVAAELTIWVHFILHKLSAADLLQNSLIIAILKLGLIPRV